MNNNMQLQECNRCLMDNINNKSIYFNEKGFCNFCENYLLKKKKIEIMNSATELEKLHKQIKEDGKGKKYDCIIGLSGGIDSSTVLVKAVEKGLRPLAVHLDNGWNSEISQNNIKNLVSKLNVDFETYIIDWEEYQNLMSAFLSANVVDIELLMDNAMISINYKYCRKYNLKHILAGTNFNSEGIKMPDNWNWFKYDKKNIVEIYKKFKKNKIKSLPTFGTLDYIYNTYIKKIKWISYLDYFNYNKLSEINNLKSNFNFKPYGHKHSENIFTRFYQNYILPNKFNIEKKKVHLSSLIMSGAISKDQAKEQLKQNVYDINSDLETDKRFFLKKIGWNNNDFIKYMNEKPKLHSEYPSELSFWMKLTKLYRFFNEKKN